MTSNFARGDKVIYRLPGRTARTVTFLSYDIADPAVSKVKFDDGDSSAGTSGILLTGLWLICCLQRRQDS